ncbi:MAG: hypothetical protein L0387_42005 [Acidobacteria bacterium]|nr:hypothetical protein [Acidobacteriota bacterium]MCI0628161.1 hypothetical protein [Acidobacteriota bacterium]MCI0718816.1 hypothetical protein [Acidobacteriota bacterium]
MKKQVVYRNVVLCLAVALAIGGQALAKGKKSLTIYEKARVNEVVLEPGNYKVEIVENGSTADVMIYRGKDLVAKASAQAEKLEKKADRNSVRLALEQDKAPKIIELRLSGEAQAYKIGSGTEASQKSN